MELTLSAFNVEKASTFDLVGITIFDLVGITIFDLVGITIFYIYYLGGGGVKTPRYVRYRQVMHCDNI